MKSIKSTFFLCITGIIIFACTSGSNASKATFKANSDSLSTDSLLTLVQKQTFQYFWTGAESNSGMAAERINMDGVLPPVEAGLA
jgi:hypothetical protein